MGTGHGCPVKGGICVGGSADGGHDVHTRRANVDGRRPVVGKPSNVVIAVCRGDGNDVVMVIVGRVVGETVVVRSIVTCRSDKEDVRIFGTADRIIQCLGEASAAPTVAHDMGTHLGSIIHADYGIGRRAPKRPEEPDCHDLSLPNDTGNPDGIVPYTGDRARTMGAMVVCIVGIAVVIIGVDPVYVVHPAIVIVVNAVVGNFPRVSPHVGSQVFVVIVYPSVNHCNDDIRSVSTNIPGFRRVDVGIVCA